MPNKVRWYKTSPNETATVQVNEGGGWKSYKHSRNAVPDGEFSAGFTTFQRCLKLGYELDNLFIASDN
jgi:hypothetical protein